MRSTPAETFPNILPVHPTTFIGREQEIARFCALLPITAQFRTTLVFVKLHGSFQLASSQVSALGRSPSFVQTAPTP
ncbi:hypothetical protein KDH_01870 [Dictyobacter sp. S3.2.2.5]|uniref:SIR2-like domain-containing protein n=1 Tax=Dictyobacter halimunensis TaxID=3026934 RepID=A0ABQ6FLB7_9CHLR|nr:hypothetical protein KDH_01870 [Dictyobacter sp. S3.2.2.5]